MRPDLDLRIRAHADSTLGYVESRGPMHVGILTHASITGELDPGRPRARFKSRGAEERKHVYRLIEDNSDEAPVRPMGEAGHAFAVLELDRESGTTINLRIGLDHHPARGDVADQAQLAPIANL